MRVLALFISLLTATCFADSGASLYGSGHGSAAVGGGLNWTNITFFLNFEANDITGDYDMQTTSCGSACEYTAYGDTTGTYAGEATLVAADPVGAVSLDIVNANDTLSFGYTQVITNISVGFWVDVTDEANNGYLCQVNNGAANSLIIRANSWTANKSEVVAFWRVAAVTELTATSATDPLDSTAGYQFVEVLVTTGGGVGVDYVKVYVDNVEIINDTTTDLTGFTASTLQAGNSTANNIGFHNPMIIISSAAERLWGFRNETGYTAP